MLAATTFTVAAFAQGILPATSVQQLTTPDGSRFVLCTDASVPQLHWVVASWVDGNDDPPGVLGLARVALEQSMLGTFRTGSRDAETERQVLSELDDAWQQLAARPGDAATIARIEQLDRKARELADPETFHRVLAALPAHGAEVRIDDPVGAFVITTLPAAIADVGAMLVERREQNAVRELPRAWLADVMRRAAAPPDPLAPLRTELLTLTLPLHPLTQQPDQKAPAAPRRDAALATWALTQHPTRTVHVLLGDFDAAAAANVLRTTFAATQLPTPAAPLPPRRLLQGQRRSQVPGASVPSLLLAWPVPADCDPGTLELGALWLADGAGSRVATWLQRNQRPRATVAVQVPWPPRAEGQALVVVEVIEPDGKPGLPEAVLTACREALTKAPEAGSLQALQLRQQRQWRDLAESPRQLAIAIAERSLADPSWSPSAAARSADPAAVHRLLQRLTAGPTALVEGRP
jgi:plasmid stabilization system protein ParE